MDPRGWAARLEQDEHGPKAPSASVHATKTYQILSRQNWQKLWKSTGQDFNLDDPYMNEVDFTYEPLHDPHLKNFFQDPVNRKRAIDLGLIDKGGRAFCSLEKFNHFRRYQHRIQADLVNKVLKQIDIDNKNKMILDRIIKGVKEDESQWRERSQLAKSRIIERIKNFKDRTVNRIRLKNKRISQFLKDRQENYQTRLACAKIRDQALKDKIAMARILQRTRVISTLEKLYQDDLERGLKKEEKLFQAYRQIEIRKQENWVRKVKHQEMRIESHDFLRKLIEQKAKKHIEKRMKKIEIERAKMVTRLENIKYLMNHPKLKKKVEEKKAKREAALAKKKEMEKKMKAEKAKLGIQAGQDDTSSGGDLESVTGDKSKAMKLKIAAPMPVKIAIRSLINNVLHLYVLHLLVKAVKDIPDLVIDRYHKLVHRYYNTAFKAFRWVCPKTGKRWPKCKHACDYEAEKEERFQASPYVFSESRDKRDDRIKVLKPPVEDTSIYSTQELRRSQQMNHRNSSMVSFGIMSVIGHHEVVDPNQLRDVRKRIPTPVPSVVQLVDSMMEDEEIDEDMMFADDKVDMRLILNSEVNKFRKWVGVEIVARAKKAIAENSRIMYKYELRDMTSNDILDKLADRFLINTHAFNVVIQTALADQLCDVLVREMFLKLNEMRMADLKRLQETTHKMNSSIMTMQFEDSEDEYEEDGEAFLPAKHVRIKFAGDQEEEDDEEDVKEVEEMDSEAKMKEKQKLLEALTKLKETPREQQAPVEEQ